MHKVSVIMPCSRPEDLPIALEIFLSQDYRNKHLIVITDESDLDIRQYMNLIPDRYISLAEFLPVGEKNTATKLTFSSFFDESTITFHIGTGTIGNKRNIGVWAADGEIIVHQDSDDYYSPGWITMSVMHLLNGNISMTGLCIAYFASETEAWEYRYDGSQPYVLGATMCYWRASWEFHRFENIQEGEDLHFCCPHPNHARVIRPHAYVDGFVARIHGKNTASHKQLHHMKPINPEIIKRILEKR